jgi:MFS family permease
MDGNVPARAAPGARPRAKTIAVISSAFLVAVSVGSAWLGILFYMREVYHVSAAAVGALAAANSLCYVSGCLLLRPVFRRVRSRDCLLISTGGSTAALLGILAVKSVAATFVLYSAFGFLMSFFWPPLAGWLSHGLESRELGRATSRFNLSWSVGNIVSSFVAGRLSDLDPAGPLRMAAIVYAAAFLLLAGLAAFAPSLRRDQHREQGPARGGAPDASTPLRFPAWVGVFAAWVVVGLITSVFPLYAREGLGITKTGIGGLLFLRSLFTTVAFLLLGRLTFWHFRVQVLAAGQLVFAGLIAAFAATRSPAGMGLLLCGIGPCGALAYSGSIFHGMAGSTERARRMGIHESMLSLGMVAGSTVGGLVYQEVSMAAALAGGACILAVSGAVQLAMSAARRRRSATPSGPARL